MNCLHSKIWFQIYRAMEIAIRFASNRSFVRCVFSFENHSTVELFQVSVLEKTKN